MFTLLPTLKNNLQLNHESGQDMAEYGLLIAFLAIVLIAAVTLLGTNIGIVLQNLAGALSGA